MIQYEQLRNVEVLVSQNGSQELRPLSHLQQLQAVQQPVAQQQQLQHQREARGTPVFIEKVAYAPSVGSDHVSYGTKFQKVKFQTMVALLPTSGSQIMTTHSLPTQIMPVNGQYVPIVLPPQSQVSFQNFTKNLEKYFSATTIRFDNCASRQPSTTNWGIGRTLAPSESLKPRSTARFEPPLPNQASDHYMPYCF